MGPGGWAKRFLAVPSSRGQQVGLPVKTSLEVEWLSLHAPTARTKIPQALWSSQKKKKNLGSPLSLMLSPFGEG